MTRITHRAIATSSLANLQQALGRIAKVQEELSTGRVLNRPSDSPTATVSALQLRGELRSSAQQVRNAEDGLGWLGMADSALQDAATQVSRARELVVAGLNAPNQSPAAREALAAEVEGLRASLLSGANTTYLGRPVFGGTSDSEQAFDTTTGAYLGDAGQVLRRPAADAQVRVDVDAVKAYGPDGELFATLDGIASSLRAGDATGLQGGLVALDAGRDRVLATLSDVGARYARLVQAKESGEAREIDLRSQLSQVESTDLPRAVVALQTEQVAYQAALGATAKVVQPSLLDFLR